MPTYEYACSACAHEWEHEQSIKDDALKECPSCHKKTARRQISRGAGFILKGGGWYSDLYSSSSNKTESKPAEGKADKSETPAASTSTSTSPATSAPAKTETSTTTPSTSDKKATSSSPAAA